MRIPFNQVKFTLNCDRIFLRIIYNKNVLVIYIILYYYLYYLCLEFI